MANSKKRDRDVSRLHPAIREKVQTIRDQLHHENIPFEVFEAFRTPERQADLFAQGRSKPGNKVTWVNAWGSIHQYGLAVDFVLFIDGKWSWDTSGARAKFWPRMHELAKEQGMTPLFNSKGKLIELPHIQLIGISSKDLRKGIYPPGGDATWAEHLSELIDNWEGTGAPPKPPSAPQRPPIDEELIAELEESAGPTPIQGNSDADAKFRKLHEFVKRAEGGFANHPEDDGGVTNFGITHKTLSDWRGTPVTEEDVKNLTQAEADQILRTNYYARCRCGELPERTAMVVYNGAVLHGPGRSVKFLQRAFNELGMTANGAPLEVDGIIGRKTTSAARETDPSILSEAYMDIQEAFLRAHHDFDTFGNGWLNRMGALREFISTLPKGAGKAPKTVMKISDNSLDIDTDDLIQLALAGATGGKSAIAKAVLGKALKKKAGESLAKSASKDLITELLEEELEVDLKAQPKANTAKLTPVNAALGEGLGRVLDGKKSIIGIVGLLGAAILPKLGVLDETSLQALTNGDNQTIIFTLLSLITGWGFLGKVDKAIREVREGT